MIAIRPPAVAGTFYPADAQELRSLISRYLRAVRPINFLPKAIVAPHAGYIYSGPVAASAYAALATDSAVITRVVLLGPSHWVALDGLAASSAAAFAMPLGDVAVDRAAVDLALTLPQVQVLDAAHVREHCLEVHLPFLQHLLTDFTIVPLLVGDAAPEEVSEVLEALWDGPETLIVISTDLSHYYDYRTAQRLDQETSRAIETLRLEDIRAEQACGRFALQGLLSVARKRHLHGQTLDLRNSGDTAGPRDEVVGYGAWVFTAEARSPQ